MDGHGWEVDEYDRLNPLYIDLGRRRRPARRLGAGDADHRADHDQRAFPRPHRRRADRQPADLGVHALLPGARHLGRGRRGAARRRGRARAALRARAGARGDLFEDRAALSPHRLGADVIGSRGEGRERISVGLWEISRGAARRDLAGGRAFRSAPSPAGSTRASSGAWPRIASPPEAGPGGVPPLPRAEWISRRIRRGPGPASRRRFGPPASTCRGPRCFRTGGPQPTLAVLGRAGSGKTLLLARLVKALIAAGVETVSADYESRRTRTRRTLAVLAPTNKAASVLRQRGVPATTIHRILYTPLYHPDYEAIAEWLTGKAERPKVEALDDAGARPGDGLLPAASVDPGGAGERRAAGARTSSRAGSGATSRSTSG